MARQVVIIGNSGSARECYWNVRDMLGDSVSIKGFLSFEGHKGALRDLAALEIGIDDSYTLGTNDELIIGIGSPALRKKIYEKWKSRGAKFMTLIHPFSFIPKIDMGEANIITCACHFSHNVSVGNANYFNGSVAVGHDVHIGDANFFGPHTILLGDAVVGSQNAFGARSTVLAKAKIGNSNTIAPGAVLYKGCGNNSVMAGNPALPMD